MAVLDENHVVQHIFNIGNEVSRDQNRRIFIIIGNDCFIGARTTILPNVKIGDGCIIAAGALVNRDIPSGEIWGGVPAHFISTTTKFAEKCKRETPEYDPVSLKHNKESELKRILK